MWMLSNAQSHLPGDAGTSANAGGLAVRISLEGFEVKNEDPMPGTGQFQKYRLKEMRE